MTQFYPKVIKLEDMIYKSHLLVDIPIFKTNMNLFQNHLIT